MKIYAFITLCIALLSMVEIIGSYPKGDFMSPVNRDIKLSGTFGELRTNHFHAGLDIKSLHQTSGDPVYAAADGHISRIKIDEFGYGNAIYIDHSDGFTTLYAHLDHFTDEIQDYIKEQQYLQKSFEVDLNPGPDKFPIVQMQQLGYMGNTGNSYGAHLHFEIRHTNDQTPVNPLHFGFDIGDHHAPVIQQLIVYQLDEEGQVLNSIIMQPKLTDDSNYLIEEPIELPSQKVAFGLRTYDTEDGDDNKNGIYSIQCRAEGKTGFEFSLDEIPFEKARYINAHIDYKEKVNENLFFHRCFPLEGNKLPIYSTGQEQGRFMINPEFPRQFTISVSDFKGNASTLSFQVVQNKTETPRAAKQIKYNTIGLPDAVTIVTQQGIQVVWPEGCFYEKTPLLVNTVAGSITGNFSPFFEIEPVDAPVHTYFSVIIDGHAVPPRLLNHAFIARCDPNGSIVNCGGTWIGHNLTTGVREMGTYAILVDTISPKIKPIHFNSTMTGWLQMDFRISDNVRIRDKGRDLIYSAYVDNEWILMSLDGKTGMLTHKFDGRIPPGDHELVIKVTDDRGNESVLEKSFTL
ncbi:MAG: M23 family metallopeptidase [Saprospiraceae bacterium]